MTALIIIAAVILLLVLILNLPAYAHIRFYGGKPDITVKYLWLTIYPKSEKAAKRSKKKADKSKSEKDDEKDTEDLSEGDSSDKDTSDKDADTVAEEKSSEKAEASEKSDKSDDEKPKGKAKKEKSKKDKTDDDAEEEKQSLPDKLNSALDDLNQKKDAFLLLWELCSGHIKKLCGKIRIDDLVIDFASANEDAADAAIGYGRMNIAVYNILAVVRNLITVTIRSVTIDCLYDTPKEKSRYDGECKVKLRPASVLNAVFAIVFGYIGNMKKYSPILDTFMKK